MTDREACLPRPWIEKRGRQGGERNQKCCSKSRWKEGRWHEKEDMLEFGRY